MSRTKITIYHDAASEWRWHRKARNGRTVGAATEGYKRKSDAVANLLAELGGILYITYSMRHVNGGLYQQGELVRADVGITRTVVNGQTNYHVNSAVGECEVIPVEVIP